MEIWNKNIISWLGKLRGNHELCDKIHYCKFHRDNGHNKNDCRTLKDETEYLIKRGYLEKYKKGPQAKQTQKQKRIE